MNFFSIHHNDDMIVFYWNKIPGVISMFLPTVRNLSTNAKYRYQILDIARDVDMYIQAGKDPEEALEFLLGFYTAVPECQEEIRDVIGKALEEMKVPVD